MPKPATSVPRASRLPGRSADQALAASLERAAAAIARLQAGASCPELGAARAGLLHLEAVAWLRHAGRSPGSRLPRGIGLAAWRLGYARITPGRAWTLVAAVGAAEAALQAVYSEDAEQRAACGREAALRAVYSEEAGQRAVYSEEAEQRAVYSEEAEQRAVYESKSALRAAHVDGSAGGEGLTPVLGRVTNAAPWPDLAPGSGGAAPPDPGPWFGVGPSPSPSASPSASPSPGPGVGDGPGVGPAPSLGLDLSLDLSLDLAPGAALVLAAAMVHAARYADPRSATVLWPACAPAHGIWRAGGLVPFGVVPLAAALDRDREAAADALTAYLQGDPAPWCRHFAEATGDAADRALALLSRVATLQAAWQQALGPRRAHSAARRLLARLPAQPILNVAAAARQLGSSEEGARRALNELAAAGVLRPMLAGRRRCRVWEAPDLVALWETFGGAPAPIRALQAARRAEPVAPITFRGWPWPKCGQVPKAPPDPLVPPAPRPPLRPTGIRVVPSGVAETSAQRGAAPTSP